MDLACLSRPHTGIFTEFASPVTIVYEYNDDIIVVADRYLYYYASFTLRREGMGLIHHQIAHHCSTRCACAFPEFQSDGSAPKLSSDLDVLFLDDFLEFYLINPVYSFKQKLRFDAPCPLDNYAHPMAACKENQLAMVALVNFSSTVFLD
jgi:hypothetical protein